MRIYDDDDDDDDSYSIRQWTDVPPGEVCYIFFFYENVEKQDTSV